MSVSNNHLNLSVTGLFPDFPQASENQLCEMISKMYREISVKRNMEELDQKKLIDMANRRYVFLSSEEKLLAHELGLIACILDKSGVSNTTIKELFAFRISEDEIKKLTPQYIREFDPFIADHI